MVMDEPKTIYLLTGDVGGTNSRMSLYYGRDRGCHLTEKDMLAVKYFRNAEHLPEAVLGDPRAFQTRIVSRFMKYCWEESEARDRLCPLEQSTIFACLAIAGIVADNAVRLTNLGNMLVDGNAIENDTTDEYLRHIKACQIINDFVAQGYGCLTLRPHEVKHLHGPPLPVPFEDFETAFQGPKVCVGAGTGLGQCYLTPHRDLDGTTSYECFPSEGGHVDYAPRSDLDIKLWKYLSEKLTSHFRISVERLVSGKGLANIYGFLAHEFPERVNKEVHEQFLQAGDEQGKVVGINAKKESHDSLCRQAMNIMMAAYGSEVGSSAIKWIPTGGLFVTGGLTPKNINFIIGEASEFKFAYLHKGRVSKLLERIPLYAVMVEDLGIRGVHYKASQMLTTQLEEKQLAHDKYKERRLWLAVVLGHIALTIAVGFPIFKSFRNAKYK